MTGSKALLLSFLKKSLLFMTSYQTFELELNRAAEIKHCKLSQATGRCKSTALDGNPKLQSY